MWDEIGETKGACTERANCREVNAFSLLIPGVGGVGTSRTTMRTTE